MIMAPIYRRRRSISNFPTLTLKETKEDGIMPDRWLAAEADDVDHESPHQ
jgi:hypothetical protein